MFKSLFLAVLFFATQVAAQIPTDFLPKEFHAKNRSEFRSKMPKNSVAVLFSNPVRNRANDVNYIFHQDPNFYYLTGYREPNAVLVLFAELQTDVTGNTYQEILYVQERDPVKELWNGKRLGIDGAKQVLGFTNVLNAVDFIENTIDFNAFSQVFIEQFKDDYRNSKKNNAEVYDLVAHFKKAVDYNPTQMLSSLKKKIYELIKVTPIENSANVAQVIGRVIAYDPNFGNDALLVGYKNATNTLLLQEFQQKISVILTEESPVEMEWLPTTLAAMREVKTAEELQLLTKAIRISAVGQIEVMKAMQPHMSETEIQGIHEFVYKKYGATYEGYPSIVGAGSNGCILHYIENNKPRVGNDLILMDLGAEYRGYTADVTRTIPANGVFSSEQKAIYNVVYAAQEAGIKASVLGANFGDPNNACRKEINQGLFALGIIDSIAAPHNYLPHGTTHYIGLDVHDPGTYGDLQENSVITVEPGIYIPNGSPCDKKWWGIAVRIEDDILITKNGPVNLSAEAPRTVSAIEAMMRKKSVLDAFILPNLDNE